MTLIFVVLTVQVVFSYSSNKQNWKQQVFKILSETSAESSLPFVKSKLKRLFHGSKHNLEYLTTIAALKIQ